MRAISRPDTHPALRSARATLPESGRAVDRAPGELPVLLPFRLARKPADLAGLARVSLGGGLLLATACLFVGSAAYAQAVAGARESAVQILLKWLPLIFGGFLFNVWMSIASMAVGTAAGVVFGMAQVSLLNPVRKLAWVATQFFRNAPWLVLLFYAMFLLPFEIRIFGVTVALPTSAKAILGLALPVAANVSEIVRGGILSIPAGQWESAESLAFSRRQILTDIILPQAFRRMLPPWMNLYAILTMATTLISVVGIQDGLTLTRAAIVAEGRPELLLPMYAMLLAMFFAYCYPIARATLALERRLIA